MRKQLVALFLLPLMVEAQQKMLTVEDAVLKQRSTLAPARLMNLAWVPKSNKFTYSAKKDGKDCVVMQDASTLSRDTVLTVEKYNSLITKATIDAKAGERIGAITWLDETTFRFTVKQSIYKANIKTAEVALVCYIPDEAEHLDIEPTTGKVAYTLNHNLVVSSLNSYKNAQGTDVSPDTKGDLLTTDGSYGNEYATSVHRNS